MTISQLDAVLKVARSICFDSRNLQPGCVFIAVRGVKVDGHQFLQQAVQAGAAGLVVEDAAQVPTGFNGPVAVVANSREALNLLAARFYREPSKELFTIGVTGTNGKTTTTHMIEAIFNEAGRACGVIGTIDHHLGPHVWKTELTTPDPLSFQKRLREFVDLGARTVALEASSHALSQARVDEVQFDVTVFTNLSRDHLDYHKDMEDYFQAKNRLFESLLARSQKPHKFAIVNGDDEFGRRIAHKAEQTPGLTSWRFGAAPEFELRFEISNLGFSGSDFSLQIPSANSAIHQFQIVMPGRHNVENAVAAIGVALAAGIGPEVCASALLKIKGVAGRLERVENKKGVHVFVDFAHTDAALAGVLTNLKLLKKDSTQIITVFGCGGDRDKGKRPLMMKAAFEGSDRVILTSDNPRSEDPQNIINDSLEGVAKSDRENKVLVEVDRREAIFKALRLARPGDVVLIAGKGHENYQQIGAQKFPFSDVQVAKEFES